jgi:hypothetical protein
MYKDEEVRRHVVYINQRACTCREWQVTGKPCPHALTVITTTRHPNMGSYVDNYYSVERFQAAYDGIVANITDKSQWPKVDKGFHLHPPIGKKRGPGRQVKNRKKNQQLREVGRQLDKQYAKDVVNLGIDKVAGGVA